MAHGWDQTAIDALQKRRGTAQAGVGATNAATVGKRPKFGNKTVLVTFGPSGELVSGHVRLQHRFDSGKEAAHYQQLVLRRQAKEIANLVLQEPLPLLVRKPSGEPEIVGEWYADFVYDDLTDGRRHYIDVKSDGTRGIETYRLKKKIIEACHAIAIEEA